MEKYRILNYKLNYNGPLNNNPFPKTSNIMWVYGTNEDNYYHNEFGLHNSDDKRALGHAMGILQKANESDLSSKEVAELICDYKNYIYCLRLNNADVNIAKIFTELLLGYGMYEEVYSVVHDYLEECNSIDKINITQSLDFSDIYVKAGDVSLFCNNNPELAVKYYKMAGVKWIADDSFVYQSLHNNISIDQAFRIDPIKKEQWSIKAEVLSNIISGNYLDIDNKTLALFNINVINREKLQLFHASMDSGKKYDINCNELVNAFLGNDEFVISDITDYSRLYAILVESIKRNCMVSVLYSLSYESKEVKERYYNEVLNAIHYIDNNDLIGIKNYVDLTETANPETVLQLIKSYVLILFIKNLLKVDPNNTVCSYYTSLDTFTYLLPTKCSGSRDSECGKLSIMNVSYMNDPNEGKMIRKFIYGDDKVIQSNDKRKNVSVGYDFIKCFTSKVDYLPMWQMYGDKAKGVCIVLNIRNLQNLQLYRICYVNKTKNGYSLRIEDNEGINTNIDDIKKYLKEIVSIFKKLRRNEEKQAFDYLLSPIHYLFKDNSYSYEQEMRMVYRFNSRSKLFKHTNQNPPKLYVLSSGVVSIDELILGPKFENVSEAAPYLIEQLDEMAEKTGISKPIITISSIDFR